MIPWPKKWAQTMFARFLAKYGFSGDASQFGQHRRGGPCPATSGSAPPRNFGFIGRPRTGWFTSPPPALKTIELARVVAALAADLA